MNGKASLAVLIVLLVLLFISLAGFLMVASATNIEKRDLVISGVAREELVIKPTEEVAEELVPEVVSSDSIAKPDDLGISQSIKPEQVVVKENKPTIAPTPQDNSSQLSDNKEIKTILKRTEMGSHTVAKGDSVSDIAKNYWGNPYLWPDLYVNNEWISKNPDLIYPLEKVRILNKLGRGSNYTVEEIDAINSAYLEVYRLYNEVGARANPSKWYTIYSATKILPDFFERNKDVIAPKDIEMAKKQVRESKVFD